jgi:putative DNA primase/helicase
LLAGWCVIAPVCGILPWRPHIWVTGGAGSGKTTVVDMIIKTTVGPIALQVASSTTESGIRQELGSDARPVIFDEAESEDKNQATRMQAILDLCRAASAQSGAKIIKGTATHSAQAFDIRSCFCFSSINTAIKHYADETRVTLMVLRPQRGSTDEENRAISEKYDMLKEQIAATLTPRFSAALLSRTMENLNTLRANIEVFVRAASVVFGSRRAADQIAPMLAGAYLLHSTKAITMDEALQWLRDNDLRDVTAAANAPDDEMRLFNFLMSHRLRFTTSSGSLDRTVGEAIQAALHVVGMHGLEKETADAELRRFGIRPDSQGGFYISTASDTIKRALGDTPWASNWARPLRMMPGADVVKSPITFSAGIRSRAIWLPISLINNET